MGLLLADVEYFAEHLDTYHRQHKMATKIYEKRPIGMLLVDATKMKGLLIPSPLRCLNVRVFLCILLQRSVNKIKTRP